MPDKPYKVPDYRESTSPKADNIFSNPNGLRELLDDLEQYEKSFSDFFKSENGGGAYQGGAPAQVLVTPGTPTEEIIHVKVDKKLVDKTKKEAAKDIGSTKIPYPEIDKDKIKMEKPKGLEEPSKLKTFTTPPPQTITKDIRNILDDPKLLDIILKDVDAYHAYLMLNTPRDRFDKMDYKDFPMDDTRELDENKRDKDKAAKERKYKEKDKE